MLVSIFSILVNVNVGKKNIRDDSVFMIMNDIRNKIFKVLDVRVFMIN